MKLIAFNKPFGVVCQFREHAGDPTLANFIPIPDVHPAGRLDKDSEGLLLLTDFGPLQHHIAEPRHKLPKTYWVQVEGNPDHQALEPLRKGIMLNDGMTKPASVEVLATPIIWERTPPIRFRQTIPTTWLAITITEGRNRQVRRMTAAIGYPTLRLIRVQIGPWTLDDLAPGSWKEITVPESTLASLARPNMAKSARKPRAKRRPPRKSR